MNSFDIKIPYVEVRNKDRDIIGIIEGAEVFFEYAHHGCGEFEIYCRATPSNLALLQKDNYITLPINADTKENQIEKNSNIWIIENIHRANSQFAGRWITATGREAKQIVDRRIIKRTTILNKNASLVSEIKTKLFDKNLTIDPTVKIGGYLNGDSSVGVARYELYTLNSGLSTGDIFIYQGETVKIGAFQDGCYDITVKYNGAIANASNTTINVFVPRKVYGFVFNINTETNEKGEYIDPIMSIKIDDETQVTYENLFDYTEELYLSYGVGAKLRFNRETKEMPYTIYKGTDRSNMLVFSRGNENLLSSDYTEDWRNYKTGGWVGGEEDETTKIRKVVELPHLTTDGKEPSDIDRREVFIDARDLSSKYEEGEETLSYEPIVSQAMLVQRGVEKRAAEHSLTIEFTGEIDVTNDRYKFNFDYYLGDIVKIRDDDFGTEILVRISKIIKVQNNEGYKEYFEYEKYEEVA